MSIRLLALYTMVGGLCIYAWKDWFTSLCGLILIMAIIHHEDMPSNMFGVQGFNVWNIMFLMIFLAWLTSRRREGLRWDAPGHMTVLFLAYFGVIIVGVLRTGLDRGYLAGFSGGYSLKDLISEELINTVKWGLPGVLLFYGCRTRKQVILALVCILAMYFLLSLQIVKRMPLESALGGADEYIQHVRLKVCASVGYSACDTSTMLAGVSWGVLASLSLVRKRIHKLAVLGVAGIVFFGQALTGGRAGYLAWGATGLMLCLLKWRKYLILAPIAILLLPILFPGAAERMLFGFGQTSAAGEATVDELSVTSDRTVMWPYVVDKIVESPLIGYGRLAMIRIGLYQHLLSDLNISFPHPHNMYLETLLDNGLLGSIPIFAFWAIMLVYSAALFRADNHLYSAVGGLALALMLAQLFAGIGAQHFYPGMSTTGMWLAMCLALRVTVEEKQSQQMSPAVPAVSPKLASMRRRVDAVPAGVV